MTNRTISEALRGSINTVERQALTIAGKSGARVVVEGHITARLETEGPLKAGAGSSFSLVGESKDGRWEWEPHVKPELTAVAPVIGPINVELPDVGEFAGKVVEHIKAAGGVALPSPSSVVEALKDTASAFVHGAGNVVVTKPFPSEDEASAAVQRKREAGKLAALNLQKLPDPDAARAAVEAKIASGAVKLASVVPVEPQAIPLPGRRKGKKARRRRAA